MRRLTINIYVNWKMVSILLATSVIIGALFANIKETKAQTSGLSGQCGMLINRSFFGFETVQANQSGQIPNSLVYIDFDGKKGQLSNSVISNFGEANATATQGPVQSGPFTISTGPVTGSYTLTFTSFNGVNVNVMPVNSGNTYLVQLPGNGTEMSPATGVCQKL